MVALVLFMLIGILMSRIGGIARRATVREHELAAIVQSSDDAIVGRPGRHDSHVESGRRAVVSVPGSRSREQPITILILRIGYRRNPCSRRSAPAIASSPLRRSGSEKDGTEIDVSLTVSPIRDAGGTIIGASKIARDIRAPSRRAFATDH